MSARHPRLHMYVRTSVDVDWRKGTSAKESAVVFVDQLREAYLTKREHAQGKNSK